VAALHKGVGSLGRCPLEGVVGAVLARILIGSLLLGGYSRDCFAHCSEPEGLGGRGRKEVDASRLPDATGELQKSGKAGVRGEDRYGVSTVRACVPNQPSGSLHSNALTCPTRTAKGRMRGASEASAGKVISSMDMRYAAFVVLRSPPCPPPHLPLKGKVAHHGDPLVAGVLAYLRAVEVERVGVAIYQDAPAHPHDQVGKEHVQRVIRLYERKIREDLVARISKPHCINVASDNEAIGCVMIADSCVKSVWERVGEELRGEEGSWG